MSMKIVKMKTSRKKYLMSQGSFDPKIRFLCQKVWPVVRVRTDGRTDTKVTTVGTLSEFFLQPIIKGRPKNCSTSDNCFYDVLFSRRQAVN